MSNEFPTQQVLELACAAQRVNGNYQKEPEAVYADDGVYCYTKQTNKMMMLVTLDPAIWTADPKDSPMPLRIQAEDISLAEAIQVHYRKLIFAVVQGDNEFLTTVNSLLNGDYVKTNQFGYVACLPSVFARDVQQSRIKKASRTAEDGYLGAVGSNLADLDCEVIESIKSKNFEGYNICAIINNKMVSWLSKTNLTTGPCVIVKAKVKAHSKHWKHQNDETRLNYVKAAQ